MGYSNNAMSIILLCSYIGIDKNDTMKPFSLGEWNQFLNKVIEMHCEPSIVLSGDLSVLKELQYTNDDINRIKKLASRGAAVAFELENLSKKGIGVVTLLDDEYPVLLRSKLKKKAPPVLYYAGDIELAGNIGIAVVGSRNISQEGIEFTKELVRRASLERLVVYSGGAKGVDSIAEKTAIENGGAVVSFIADSLLERIKKKEILDWLIGGKILLVSDVKPETGFSAARAMNRNKYIYASSYGAFVVESDYKKGGTWTGAVESIKNKWSKVFVWDNKNCVGNQQLIALGSRPYILSDEKIYDIITKREVQYNQLDIFNINQQAMVMEGGNSYCTDKAISDVYSLVSGFIADNLEDGMNLDSVSKKFNVAKGQMKVWLTRMCSDGFAKCEKGIYYKSK